GSSPIVGSIVLCRFAANRQRVFLSLTASCSYGTPLGAWSASRLVSSLRGKPPECLPFPKSRFAPVAAGSPLWSPLWSATLNFSPHGLHPYAMKLQRQYWFDRTRFGFGGIIDYKIDSSSNVYMRGLLCSLRTMVRIRFIRQMWVPLRRPLLQIPTALPVSPRHALARATAV
ncbi:MAG: hypothetical protein ACXV5R_10965, partial [Candidatus Angelobacter sp.]